MSASFLPLRTGASISVSGVSMVLRRHRQVAGDLVGEEQADLAQELAEAGGRGVALAHERQLVLDQRVVDDRQVLGHRLLAM